MVFREFIDSFINSHLRGNFPNFNEAAFSQKVSKIFSRSGATPRKAIPPLVLRRPGARVFPKGLRCPICDKTLENRSRLLEHLSYNHFAQELEALQNPANPSKCVVCGRESHNQKLNVVHLGAVHEEVLRVMPGELARQIEAVIN